MHGTENNNVSTPHKIDARAMTATVAGIFERLGLKGDAATRVAAALVDADLEGIPSHGVMLVPMYANRLRSGSVSLAAEAAIVSDHGACVVLDAGNMLGQLSADQAVTLAGERAPWRCATPSTSVPPDAMRAHWPRLAASASSCPTRAR